METRCIVWHPRGPGLPADLLAALDRRHLPWKAWDSDLLALAEACAPVRGPDEAKRILLLVEPRRLDHLAEVVDAIDRYRPSLTIWVFDPALPGKLVARTPSEITREFAAPAQSPQPAARSVVHPPAGVPSRETRPAPVLRLTDAPLPTADFAPGTPNARAALLTDEELGMLLAPDAPEARESGPMR